MVDEFFVNLSNTLLRNQFVNNIRVKSTHEGMGNKIQKDRLLNFK